MLDLFPFRLKVKRLVVGILVTAQTLLFNGIGRGIDDEPILYCYLYSVGNKTIFYSFSGLGCLIFSHFASKSKGLL